MKPVYYFIILLAAVYSGCKSSQKIFKEDIKERRKDSTAFIQTAKLDTFKAAKETAKALLPAKWLYDNPGTPYEASSGRAKVSVKLVHDTIQVQAECDSLQKVIASIHTQLYQLQQQRTEKQTSEVVHTVEVPWQLQLTGWLLVASLIGYIALSIIKRFKLP